MNDRLAINKATNSIFPLPRLFYMSHFPPKIDPFISRKKGENEFQLDKLSKSIMSAIGQN